MGPRRAGEAGAVTMLHIELSTIWIWVAAGLAHILLCELSEEVNRRTLNFLISLDQLAWVVITLGNGSPDETISAALWRMERAGKLSGRLFRPLIDLLFRPLERDHCRKAYEAERRGVQLPKEYHS